MQSPPLPKHYPVGISAKPDLLREPIAAALAI